MTNHMHALLEKDTDKNWKGIHVFAIDKAH